MKPLRAWWLSPCGFRMVVVVKAVKGDISYEFLIYIAL